MQNNSLSKILIILMILTGIAGIVLWSASYFIGIIFIAAALVLYYFYKRSAEGGESAGAWAKGFIKTLYIPVFGIIAAIILGGIIMIITGNDPVVAYKALFYGGFVRSWHISILNAVPLIFTGLSVAFAFQAGLFNIGAEGQFYIGSMMATWLGLRLGMPPVFSIFIIFIVSGLAAAAYNIVPAALKVKTGAHEVITTMMLAHVARHLSPIFIRGNGGDPASSTHAYVTDDILENNFLPIFKDFLPNANYRLHVGILIAIAVAVLVYYILYYTRIGFEVRAVGQNPNAARAQGISIGKNIMIALLFAGFLSGLAGVNQVVGLDHKMFQNLSAGYGWNGISVAILASNNPIGVIFTSILWGALDAGGQYMTRTTQIPNSIVEIIKGIILFLIVARYIYTYFGNRMKKRRIDRKIKEAV
ncbi:MAG: ABC transporter permease [Spirochaetales bacterium]|uniref:ABC transporter permease n=1 Tax=Candidatus Thalassospirochaeta sargassi TaxID=3119039 RepID=A0AAJ1MM87_9SPIO|nr:ABC transporter permease [Spirochaetales bacterium]